MKTETKRFMKKFDLKFVFICVASIALITFLCVFTGKPTYEQKDLPGEYESNISKLIINEIVSSNKGVYANKNNEVCDYLEIYNGNDYDINLNGYGLSDDDSEIKWTFTNTIIKAKDYVVVNLVGKSTNDPLDANFKLSSSKSERVIFTNPAAKIIDAVDTVNLQKNTCMVRDEDGNWYVSNYCTPGYENSINGLDAYHNSLLSDNDEKDIVVNELLLKNKGNYIDGKYSSYGAVEIKNISSKIIDLGEYFISNDRYLPFKKKLGNQILNPGDIYVLYMGDGSYYDSKYLGFNFPGEFGDVIISRDGKIVQELNYENIASGDSLCYMNGEYYQTSTISIGYENNAQGIDEFQNKYLKNRNGLLINEVCNSNFSYLAQNGNEFYDYVELYNNSNNTINLADYYLSDSDTIINKYQLPDIELKPNEYFIIMCSGDSNLSNPNYYHTNFKISDNDSVFLSDNNGIVDCMHIGNVPVGYSYGRNENCGYFYMLPSPLEKNNDGVRVVASDPIINLPAGLYNDIDTVKVSITCFGDVYYTTNGNEPTVNDYKYNGEIELLKTCVLKAKCIQKDGLSSNTVTATYIINENHDIPVISLSLNKNDLLDLNVNFRLHDYYFPGYVEYFDGDNGFDSKCGIGIFGDESRQYPKKNYVMKFAKEFGADDLAYRVFDDRDYSSYDTLCIRAGGQDWDEGIIRDTLMTSLIDDYTDVTAYTCKNVVAYVNGEYWGLYVIKEKKTRDFFEENYNFDGNTINLVKGYLEADWGSEEGFEEIRQYCLNHDATSKETFDYLSSKLNITNWADFWIGHLYCANIDYNNIRYFQSDEYDDGKWNCIFYDLDFGMIQGYTHDTYTRSLTRADGFWCHWLDKNRVAHDRVDNTVIKTLLHNPYFKEVWLERLKYNLEYTWNKQRVLDYVDELTTQMSGEIARDRTRWGQSLELYNSEIDKIKDFINHRQSYIMKYTQSFFNLSNEEMKNIFGDLYE